MKKGYFFTLDAILALLLFTTVVILIHIFYINSPPLSQLYFLSSDTIDVLSYTQMSELDSNKYPFMTDPTYQNHIKDDLTILEQLRVFKKAGVSDQDIILAEDQLLSNLYPGQYDFNIRLDSTDPATTTSNVIVVSRRLVSSVSVS